MGPLPPSQGHTYLLTCVDRFSRWSEAIPLTNISAETVAQAFISGWISRFGIPSSIVTDRGRQFESQLWSNLMTLLGTKHSRTTAYHSQANGMVERFHRQLKAALKAQSNRDDWMTSLPLVLLGIRTAYKQDLDSISAELVYGTSPRLPGFTPSPPTSLPNPSEFLNKLKSHFRHITPTAPRPASSISNIPKDLATATHVFIRHDAVRKPLQPPYHRPYPIIKQADKHYTIKLNDRTDTVSIDRLKPAHLDSTVSEVPNSKTPTTSPTPSQPTSSSTNTRTTRSGRRVHFPAYLSYV